MDNSHNMDPMGDATSSTDSITLGEVVAYLKDKPSRFEFVSLAGFTSYIQRHFKIEDECLRSDAGELINNVYKRCLKIIKKKKKCQPY